MNRYSHIFCAVSLLFANTSLYSMDNSQQDTSAGVYASGTMQVDTTQDSVLPMFEDRQAPLSNDSLVKRTAGPKDRRKASSDRCLKKARSEGNGLTFKGAGRDTVRLAYNLQNGLEVPTDSSVTGAPDREEELPVESSRVILADAAKTLDTSITASQESPVVASETQPLLAEDRSTLSPNVRRRRLSSPAALDANGLLSGSEADLNNDTLGMLGFDNHKNKSSWFSKKYKIGATITAITAVLGISGYLAYKLLLKAEGRNNTK